MTLQPGATNTPSVVVDESMTADRFGNSGVHVLATPMLVSYFELTAHQPRGTDRGGQAVVGCAPPFLDILLRPAGQNAHG